MRVTEFATAVCAACLHGRFFVVPGGKGRLAAALVSCLLAVAGAATAGTPKSSVPFLYVIDYSDKWIKDARAAEPFGDLPPDVLHIGKSVPVTHIWGPVPLLAGENQHTGGPGHTLDRNAIRLLTPADLEQRIADITAAVSRLHAAGIRQVMPYICHYSIAGSHETHEGLWAFYDRWDEYARWLGPKPPEGPTEWVTKDAQGNRIETGYGLTPAYFAPLHRYAVCPNNPSWNQFCVAIVKLIAQCGYDGVFVDNSFLGGDQCAYCEAAFRQWIGRSFDAATLGRACATPEPGDISLRNPRLAPLLDRWHIAVVRDRLATLRRAGAEVKPGFQIFPNVGNLQRAIAYGDGCDLFMFESTPPPGCVISGEIPRVPEALINVATGAALTMAELPYNGTHPELFSEVTGTVRYPSSLPPGGAAEIAVRLSAVGSSDTDSDCLEGMTAKLTHLDTGQSATVPLGPEPGVGDPNTVAGAKRPPVELKGTWTPAAAGAYALDIVYRYTDKEHLAEANQVPICDRLTAAEVYRVGLGTLACSYNSRSRMIGLVEKIGGKGWENVQELALAEGAANGGRYAVQSSGEPQKKYGRFFRQYGTIGAGLVPYGAVSLLYAYWGGNPGGFGQRNAGTVQDYLSGGHVLYRGLVDRDLERADLEPAMGQTLVLVCRRYELTPEQMQALRDFVAHGGRLFLEHEDTQVNFAPFADATGIARESIARWDHRTPPCVAPALCGSDGRGRGVRFTAFADPGPEPKRLVLHILNYNVSAVEAQPGTVTVMPDLTVQVPLPGAWHEAKATVYDPDQAAPIAADCSVEGNLARVRLPALRIYQMLELATR